MEIHIWQARTDKNVSLEELSDETGISLGALSNYENGKRYPRIDQLEKIAEVLEVTISDLYDSRYK
jgi:transcriptional regulator with XRE-family HTH domain